VFHVGHLTILERARSLGDKLVVGVPSDEVVLQDKGKFPFNPLVNRCRVLNALQCVDVVLPYYRLEFLRHLKLLHPDVLVVGEDWGNKRRHRDAEQWMRNNDGRIVSFPRHRGISSTEIAKRLQDES